METTRFSTGVGNAVVNLAALVLLEGGARGPEVSTTTGHK
jgi:hypothetical protein